MKRKLFIGLLLGAALSLSVGVFAACTGNDDVPEHEHIYTTWETVTEPTCEGEGKESATCDVCGEATTRKIDPLDHEWELVSTTDSTCTEEGVKNYVCLRDATHVKSEVIEATGHTLTNKIKDLLPATCEEWGYKIVECDVCHNDIEQEIPALGHNYGPAGQPTVADPTCTEEGEKIGHCIECGKDVVTAIPALGHSWVNTYTIIPADWDHAGEKYRECSRCDDVTDVTVIPALNADTPVRYSLRLVRNNGDVIPVADVGYEIYDGNELIASGTFRNGEATVSINPNRSNYRVELTNIPSGYTVNGTYNLDCVKTVDNGESNSFAITGSLRKGNPPSNLSYVQGSVLYDFTITTITTKYRQSETITISDLLQQYKFVMLNFFYVDCSFCKDEFPGMELAYQQYKDDMVIIAIDDIGYSKDSEAYIRNFVNQYNLSFYVAMDTLGLAQRFSLNSWPITVIIDQEGVISELHRGALINPSNYSDTAYCTAQFVALFEKYSTAPHYNAPSSVAELEYVLPSKSDEN